MPDNEVTMQDGTNALEVPDFPPVNLEGVPEGATPLPPQAVENVPNAVVDPVTAMEAVYDPALAEALKILGTRAGIEGLIAELTEFGLVNPPDADGATTLTGKGVATANFLMTFWGGNR